MSETQQGRADESRRPSKAAPASVVDPHRSPIARLADPVLVFDATGQIVYVNPTFEELCGYDVDELVGRPTQVLIPKRFQRGHCDVRDRFVSDPTGSVDRYGEAILLKKDGFEVPVERRLTPIETPTGPIILALVVDISERKSRHQSLRDRVADLELRLEQRTAELEQRTEDLEAFSISVSHDLRAPIRVMRAYAQALLKLHGEDMDESAREFTTRIVDSTAGMELMLERLLDYGRALAGSAFELSPVNLLRVFHETLRYLNAYVLESGAVVTISGGDHTVLGHETTLVQVVANLVRNAIKFTRAGEAPLVTLGAEREPDRVRLWVQDRGIGVPPEDRDRIFRIFERSHNAKDYSGSGVGLAIVKKGVERMHGQVGVESTPGEGSLFWVTLPAA